VFGGLGAHPRVAFDGQPSADLVGDRADHSRRHPCADDDQEDVQSVWCDPVTELRVHKSFQISLTGRQ